ncbi:MAG TPA: hypothetical protein VFF73_23420 [Planctomycetota bacterium]|nr:hypothetical protein [Planctomycetota bacterium]
MPRKKSPLHFAAGIAIWASLVTGGVAFATMRKSEIGPPAERVLRYAVHAPGHVDTKVLAAWDEREHAWIAPLPGDPILEAETRTFVGVVESVTGEAAAVTTPSYAVRLALDPEYDPRDLEGAVYGFDQASGDGPWILNTLLPPRKWAIVQAELAAFVDSHSDEIAEAVRPVGDEVVAHAMEVLNANLASVVARHEKEIDALTDKYRGTLKDDLLPVLKEQLGPSAKEKAKPLLTKIGRELWDALPLARGVWEGIKDRTPFMESDHADKWWNEFLENKAIPIVKAHEAELMKAGEDLVKEGLKDPKVRAAFSETARKLAKDPEFQALLRTIVEEALVRPFDLGGLVKKIATNPKHRARFAALQDRFAPTLEKIIRLVAVEQKQDGRDGLSKEVALVLRRKVLNKDARWVSVRALAPLRPLTGRGKS